MFADLVIDATGRGSRSPRWLESLGIRTAETGENRSQYRLHHAQVSPCSSPHERSLACLDICHSRRQERRNHRGPGRKHLDSDYEQGKPVPAGLCRTLRSALTKAVRIKTRPKRNRAQPT